MWAYLLAWWLAGSLPGGVGAVVWHGFWRGVWLYCWAAAWCTAIRWVRWVAGGLVVAVVQGTVEGGRRLGRLWWEVAREHWKVGFGIAVVWCVSVGVADAPIRRLWEDVVGWAFLRIAEVVYGVGDVVRDMAGGPHWDVWIKCTKTKCIVVR
ncbi:hypothetical protein VTK26DRAFT_2189 [Humicola hyalothermophila]